MKKIDVGIIGLGVGRWHLETYMKSNYINNIYISDLNKRKYIPGSASLIVSEIDDGRVILFADNPNFRGTWYGTNKLFLNAIFLSDNISVPSEEK